MSTHLFSRSAIILIWMSLASKCIEQNSYNIASPSTGNGSKICDMSSCTANQCLCDLLCDDPAGCKDATYRCIDASVCSITCTAGQSSCNGLHIIFEPIATTKQSILNIWCENSIDTCNAMNITAVLPPHAIQPMEANLYCGNADCKNINFHCDAILPSLCFSECINGANCTNSNMECEGAVTCVPGNGFILIDNNVNTNINAPTTTDNTTNASKKNLNSEVWTCANKETCKLDCIGDSYCQNGTFRCINSTLCEVFCHSGLDGAGGQCNGLNIIIDGSTSADIHCTGDSEHCGPNLCSNMNITSINSPLDVVHFTCDQAECTDTIIHCDMAPLCIPQCDQGICTGSVVIGSDTGTMSFEVLSATNPTSLCSQSESTIPVTTYGPNGEDLNTASSTTITSTTEQTNNGLTTMVSVPDKYMTTENEQSSSLSQRSTTAAFSKLYTYVSIAFLSLFLLIGCIACIDARKFHKNDLFQVSCIIIFALYTMDFISDIFFAATVSQEKPILIFVASCIFLIVPLLFNLFQLRRAIVEWVNDKENGLLTIVYIDEYSKFLYAVTMISGSGFAAVKLLNSGLFRLKIFDMGLKKHQMTEFQNKRIFSVVLLENIPQIILQAVFAYISDELYPITIMALIFSIFSIILSIFEYSTRKSIVELNDQNYDIYSIKFDVVSSDVLNKRKSLKYQRAKINKNIAEILEINSVFVEQLRSKEIKGGLQLLFRVTFNANSTETSSEEMEKTKCEIINDLISDKIQDGSLTESIKISWKLNIVPLIKNLNVNNLQINTTSTSPTDIQVHTI